MRSAFLQRSCFTFFRSLQIQCFTTSHFCNLRCLHRSSKGLSAPRIVWRRPCCLSINSDRATSNITGFRGDGRYQEEYPILPNDTIFALSSGVGVTAGVAVIRVSGHDALFCLTKLLQIDELKQSARKGKLPSPRYASVRKLYNPSTGELLDEAIVIYFRGPKSFTGEDVVEFHVHGSRAVTNGVVEALESLNDLDSSTSRVRPAERGEFTRRAFENGRMDLTSVEGLADLIAAETAMQRKQALAQLGGEVRNTVEGWREEIKNCLAHAEAVIDFGDDVDDDAFEAIVPRVAELRRKMEEHLHDRHRGEIVRGGAKIAIVGKPNAGKSTLLNALAKRPAAIVSPQAGTTRDVVEVQLDLNGLAVVVSDTAGLRDKTNDAVEIEGMKRARDAASNADVTILVHDASQGGLEAVVKSFPSLVRAAEETEGKFDETASDLVCVVNKIDLLPNQDVGQVVHGVPVFKTCLLRNEGITELARHVEHILRSRLEGSKSLSHISGRKAPLRGDAPVITRARHRYHMTAAVSALTRFVEGRSGVDRDLYLPMDLATEDLRIAGRELGAITGVIHSEELLDVIFSDFCIGK